MGDGTTSARLSHGEDMDRVVVDIRSDSGSRASEIIADVRAVAETLYYPMKSVGFWDHREDMHLSRERAESRIQQWQQELAGIPLGQRVPEGNQELVTSSGRPPLLTKAGKQ